jgi:predicted transposase/invertase (TIGR01784 family)
MKAPTVDDQEQRDWLTFFKRAAFMTEDMVEASIKTDAVKQAFRRVKIATMPANVLKEYYEEDNEYDRYSTHTKELVTEGKIEGKIERNREIERNKEIAKSLKNSGMPVADIIKHTGLDVKEVEKL